MTKATEGCWPLVRLDELAIRGSGHTPSKRESKYWNGDIPWVSLGDTTRLDKGEITRTASSTTADGIAHSAAVVRPAGTVILLRGSSVGKSAVLGRPMAVSQDYVTWTCGPSLHNWFLYHLLQYWKPEFARIGFGNTVKTIGLEFFERLEIPLPSLSEQRIIAGVLSDTDESIGAAEALINKKRAIKLSMMQDLLTGRTRLPGFTGDWRVVRLGSVLKVRNGRSQRDVEVLGGRYPILATGGEIGRTNIPIYDKPSVLIGRKGTIDRPQFQENPFWTVDTLFYTEIGQRANPRFLYYMCTIIDWMSMNEATGVPSLTGARIESIEIVLPGLDEQRAVARVIQDADAEIEALERRLEATRAVKQGMMQELLTGRTRLGVEGTA